MAVCASDADGIYKQAGRYVRRRGGKGAVDLGTGLLNQMKSVHVFYFCFLWLGFVGTTMTHVGVHVFRRQCWRENSAHVYHYMPEPGLYKIYRLPIFI